MKKLVIDLDETLTLPPLDGVSDYAAARPRAEVIEKLLEYKKMGFDIVIFTSRNMRTHQNSIGKINALTLPVIIEWLNKNKIPYDEIHVGKPWCGTEGFYVDDKAIRPDEFVSKSYEEIRILTGGKP
jgi:capsule biosynthesis phosphatase